LGVFGFQRTVSSNASSSKSISKPSPKGRAPWLINTLEGSITLLPPSSINACACIYDLAPLKPHIRGLSPLKPARKCSVSGRNHLVVIPKLPWFFRSFGVYAFLRLGLDFK